MWPLRNREQRHNEQIERSLDPIEGSEVAELYASMQRLQLGLSAQLGRLEGLELRLKQHIEDVERMAREIVKEHQADYSRVVGQIDVVRGMASGANRGPKRAEERHADQQALELGKRVIAACATPEGALALAQEFTEGARALQGAAVLPNGHVPSAPPRASSPV